MFICISPQTMCFLLPTNNTPILRHSSMLSTALMLIIINYQEEELKEKHEKVEHLTKITPAKNMQSWTTVQIFSLSNFYSVRISLSSLHDSKPPNQKKSLSSDRCKIESYDPPRPRVLCMYACTHRTLIREREREQSQKRMPAFGWFFGACLLVTGRVELRHTALHTNTSHDYNPSKCSTHCETRVAAKRKRHCADRRRGG